MIREWAVANGHMRPESRGRIPGAIVEMWENRGKGTQTAMPSPAPADPLAAKGRELAATFVDDKGNPVDPSKKAQGETAKPAKPVAPKKEAAREPAKA